VKKVLVLFVLISFFISCYGCSSEPVDPTPSDLYKSQALKFVEEASKLKSMTEQGVDFATYSDQLAEVHGVYEILSSLWADGLEPEAQENIQLALKGWDYALSFWKLKIDNPYTLLEYGETKDYYDEIYSYGGDDLVIGKRKLEVRDSSGNKMVVNKLEYEENVSALFMIANGYFDKAKSVLLQIIQ